VGPAAVGFLACIVGRVGIGSCLLSLQRTAGLLAAFVAAARVAAAAARASALLARRRCWADRARWAAGARTAGCCCTARWAATAAALLHCCLLGRGVRAELGCLLAGLLAGALLGPCWTAAVATLLAGPGAGRRRRLLVEADVAVCSRQRTTLSPSTRCE
jgi:hypothetical protein